MSTAVEEQDGETWHHGPRIGSDASIVINGGSRYVITWDVDGADWQHVSGPKIDADSLAEIARDITAYDYHPSQARLYCKDPS